MAALGSSFSGKPINGGMFVGLIAMAAGVGVATGLLNNDRSVKSYILFSLPCVLTVIFFAMGIKTSEGFYGLALLGLLGTVQLICRAITISQR